MARGPKPIELVLAGEERSALERIARRRKAGQALAQRARIVLACAEPGSTNMGVARALGVSRPSVTTWRARFAAHRLGSLDDAPRSGAPRKVSNDEVERLVALTLETQPEGATHWSTRGMAKQVGMSQTMVSRVWRVRLGPAPFGDVQALVRPGLRGQSARRGRPLHGPARPRAGAVRGREAADPSGRAHRPRAADAPGPA